MYGNFLNGELMEKRNLNRKGALNLTAIGLFIAAGVIAAITVVMSTKVAEGGWAEFLHTLDRLQEFIMALDNRYLIVIAILGVYILRGFLPIPFPFILMMTGVMFQPVSAIIINTIGTAIVLLITYFWGKVTGGGVAIKKLEKYDNIKEILDHHGKTKLGVLVALRVIPSVPMNLVSKVFGGMKFPIDAFMVASLLGFFPKIWTYSVMGGNIAQPFTWKFMGPIIFLLILSGVATLIVNITLDKRKGENKDEYSDA